MKNLLSIIAIALISFTSCKKTSTASTTTEPVITVNYDSSKVMTSGTQKFSRVYFNIVGDVSTIDSVGIFCKVYATPTSLDSMYRNRINALATNATQYIDDYGIPQNGTTQTRAYDLETLFKDGNKQYGTEFTVSY